MEDALIVVAQDDIARFEPGFARRRSLQETPQYDPVGLPRRIQDKVERLIAQLLAESRSSRLDFPAEAGLLQPAFSRVAASMR